jgi:hypothetical protein
MSLDETLVIEDYLKKKNSKFPFPNVSLDETLVMGDYLRKRKKKKIQVLTCHNGHTLGFHFFFFGFNIVLS